jgi:xylulokinase
MLPHDYVNFRLTGERVAEAGDASGTGYFDATARSYDLERAAAIDERLPGMLPRLLSPGEAAGRLSADGASLLGLPSGIPVAAGSGDNMCSAVGSGATRAGVAVLSLGTSATVFSRTTSPRLDPEGLIAPFCDASDGWLPLLCVMNATGVAEEVRRASGLDHAELGARASAVAPGSDGLLWLPYLVGERVPDLPRAAGAMLGIRPGSLDPGVLYRAGIEGVALNLAAGVDRMRSLGIAVERVRVVGGASASDLWCRVLADVLGVSIVRAAEPESAALGAALLAAWTVRRANGERTSVDEVAAPFARAVGEPFEPDPGAAAVYADASARFMEAQRSLFGAG